MTDNQISYKSIILLISLIIATSLIIIAWEDKNPLKNNQEPRNVTLDSQGVSLVIEPSIAKPKERDFVQFRIMIVNDNPFPVRIPVFSSIYMGHSPDDLMPSVFISWLNPYIEIGASSSIVIHQVGYQVHYPVFELYVSVSGVIASIELEVKQ